MILLIQWKSMGNYKHLIICLGITWNHKPFLPLSFFLFCIYFSLMLYNVLKWLTAKPSWNSFSTPAPSGPFFLSQQCLLYNCLSICRCTLIWGQSFPQVFHLLSHSGLGRKDKVGNEVTASVDNVSLSVPDTHTARLLHTDGEFKLEIYIIWGF